MSWAKFAKEALAQGRTAQVRPRGHSMKGEVNNGDLVTPEPCDLHLIKAVNQGRFLISNNCGGMNGWVGRNCIYGKATKVESR